MKTTIEISDELFRKAEARAASRGETLPEFISEALTARLASTNLPPSGEAGWRSVFGLADPSEIERIDALLESEFEQVDPADWR